MVNMSWVAFKAEKRFQNTMFFFALNFTQPSFKLEEAVYLSRSREVFREWRYKYQHRVASVPSEVP